jgi:hypothetical protein
MKLSAPKTGTWWAALILGALGALVHYQVVRIAFLAPYAFLLVAAGLVLLLVASATKGL